MKNNQYYTDFSKDVRNIREIYSLNSQILMEKNMKMEG